MPHNQVVMIDQQPIEIDVVNLDEGNFENTQELFQEMNNCLQMWPKNPWRCMTYYCYLINLQDTPREKNH